MNFFIHNIILIDKMSREKLDERIIKAEEYKTLGNECFKNNDIKNAAFNYHLAYLYVKNLVLNENDHIFAHNANTGIPQDRDFITKQDIEKINILIVQILSNLAAIHIKMEKYEKVILDCDAGLKIDKNNAKLYFRRGQSRLRLKDTDRAQIDLNKAKEIIGKPNLEIEQELFRLRREITAQNERHKKVCSAMFG